MSDEYVAQGSFANCSINGFKQYVKDGVLDVERVKEEWALNDAQIPHLEIELKAAGYLPETKPAEAVTQSFRVRPQKSDEPALVTE
jgi:hypothetical protein